MYASAQLYAFDLLELDGQDLRREPIERRKEELHQLLGRDRAGKDQLVGVRLPDATIRRIGAWAKREGVASRSEAIRRLIDQSLVTATQSSRRRRHKGASKAREWAGQEIDRRANQSLPAEERKRRKDRLTKGPSEFREMRDDLPKPTG
jgi:hypothetical protein